MSVHYYSGVLSLCDADDRDEPLKHHNKIGFTIRFIYRAGRPAIMPSLGDPGEPAEAPEIDVDRVGITAGVPVPQLWKDRAPGPDPQIVEDAPAPKWLEQIILTNFDEGFLVDYVENNGG